MTPAEWHPAAPSPLRRPGDAAAKPPNVQSRLGSCQTCACRIWFVPPVPSAPPPPASSYENTFLLVLVNTLKRGFYASSELAQPKAKSGVPAHPACRGGEYGAGSGAAFVARSSVGRAFLHRECRVVGQSKPALADRGPRRRRRWGGSFGAGLWRQCARTFRAGGRSSSSRQPRHSP